MHWEKPCQQLEGDPVPLLSPSEATFGVLCPVLHPSVQDTHGAPGADPGEGNKDDEETEHLIHEERLKELGLFSLKKK